ncbi:four-helix bundle copper-binding protein [Pseudomonas sp. PIC25]|uniref:four-helix bundle copper-binding protein n=1 Tax=Pseudomonas sp. PIC25 TaxID=1958773 RepID=UPI000BAC126E|nr:four-helix bundle copper-binding protein [Pseudomonas sp. PIC25]PAU51174.1 four-helix bundle copper-binding protein [Pseudomonas sp. PIC25]
MSTQRYASCIQACNACAVACEHCAAACLQEAMIKDLVTCIRLDRDCADMCRLASRLMCRESALVDEICRLCAIACRACGQECAKHLHEHCQQCAQACERCAEECESMSRAA